MVTWRLLLIVILFSVGNADDIATIIKEKLNTTEDLSKSKTLESSTTSDTSAIKLTSPEKLGTAATIPIGYATKNGIVYDAPLTSGSYASLGAQPGSFIAPMSNYHHQHHPPVTVHGGPVVVGPSGLQPPGHTGPSVLVQQQELGGGGYGGVVYGGHGQPYFPNQEQTIYKQPPGVITPILQPADGGVLGKFPYTPYGHSGVVYMGNGLISEQAVGLKPLAPVLPPPGYHHKQVGIKEKGIHGQQFGFDQNPHFLPPSHGGYKHKGRAFGGYQSGQPFVSFPYHQNPPPFDKGYDDFGRDDLSFRKQQPFIPNGGRGFGYNGLENSAIAHTDEVIVPRRHYYPHPYDGRGLSNPDPYFNNQLDPFLRTGGIGHAMTLHTTGPNRYYQGKNPIGVYERYHKLG